MAEVTIQALCQVVHTVLCTRTQFLGYTDDDELADQIYLDHDIHVHSAAQELGFSSFKDFLHSEHMKEFVDIITANGVTSYHWPMATVLNHWQKDQIQQHFERIQKEVKELRRKPRFWTPKGAKNFRPQMQKLLLKRHKMRMNIPESDEEEKPEHPPPTRGRWVNRGGHPTSGRGRWVNRGGCEPSSSAKKRFP